MGRDSSVLVRLERALASQHECWFNFNIGMINFIKNFHFQYRGQNSKVDTIYIELLNY